MPFLRFVFVFLSLAGLGIVCYDLIGFTRDLMAISVPLALICPAWMLVALALVCLWIRRVYRQDQHRQAVRRTLGLISPEDVL